MKKMDLHIHSNYSDGHFSIRSIIEMAELKNLTHIAITDHFTTTWKKLVIKTLNLKKISKYIDEIKRERVSSKVTCLIGIEIDMGSNINKIKQIPFHEFDIVLFEYTESLVTLKSVIALKNEFKIKAITSLAHNGYFKIANLEKFNEFLVENEIYFELNSRYLNKKDPNVIHKIKIMKDRGVKFTIGSDAHTKHRIGDIATSISILEKIDGFKNLINFNHKRYSPF